VLVLQPAERPARDAGRCGFESRRAHPAPDEMHNRVAGLSASLAQLDKAQLACTEKVAGSSPAGGSDPRACAFVAPVVERARGMGEGDGSNPSEGST
jgi:hypothetical protein